MNRKLSKIAAVLALIIGAMAVVAGGGVLLVSFMVSGLRGSRDWCEQTTRYFLVPEG